MTVTFRPATFARIVLTAAIAFAAACNSAPAPAAGKSGGNKPVDPATAGSITGRITFTGQAPAVEPVNMASDQACIQGSGPGAVSDAVVIAADGALKNVFVHVKEGLDPAYGFVVPTSAVVLDQKGC